MSKLPYVLFLLHLPPPVHGSSEIGRYIKESKLINNTFDCKFINLLASRYLSETGKVSSRKIFDFLITFLKVTYLLVKKRPALCYLALSTTGPAFYKDLLLVILLKLFRVRRIYHLHNKGVSLHQHKPLDHFFYQFVFQGAEIILLSDYLYSDIGQFVSKKKVHICPYGIIDIVQDQPFKTQALPPRILFLSNLIESKGVFVLLEAMAILKQKGILFEGVFIGAEGDITAAQFTEHVKKLGLNDQVSYQGRKFGKEKHHAFSGADLFAFPTYYSNETFGLVNLEAMQHYLPVISTFEGGIPDVVEDGVTGFLIPQKNTEALAGKLEVLLANPELRRQMGSAGRRKYEQEFTLERFEKRMIEILEKVLEK